MRAMPSPTERTVPTSETCASASKFAIWSRMTREISAARMSIQLAFHRLSESVEFGADGSVDLLASQLDDDPAKNVWVDGCLDVDVAACASAKLLLQSRELIVIQRARGDHLGRCFAAMLSGKPAERANDVPKFVLAAVPGENAEEVGSGRIEVQLRRECGEGLAGCFARHEGARH